MTDIRRRKKKKSLVHSMYKQKSSAGEATGVDCFFHVGDDNCKFIVKVNKNFLAAKSSVFEKMFSGSFPQEDVVEITDITPEAFTIMLKFLRSEPVCFLLKQVAVDVLYAAEKYELLELKQKCEDFLLPKTVADVWWVAPHAYRYNSTVLQKAIRALLRSHASAFISDDNFLEASEELVLDVVRLDYIANVGEMEIFKAVVDWAKHQLTKEGVTSYNGEMLQQKLQKVLKYIRLDDLSSEDEHVVPHFLNSKKISDILKICDGEKDKFEEVNEAGEDEVKEYNEINGPFITLPMVNGVTTNKLPPKVETFFTSENVSFQIKVAASKSPKVSLRKLPSRKKSRLITISEPLSIDVTASYSPDVTLCFRKRILEESVQIIQKADLLSVIFPSKLASSDCRSSHYWENVKVSVMCSGYTANRICLPHKIYGSGLFRGIVDYGQEIHIPITRSGNFSTFAVSDSYPLTYSLKFFFHGQSLYPWQPDRRFPSNKLLKTNGVSAGCIKGYRFRPLLI